MKVAKTTIVILLLITTAFFGCNSLLAGNSEFIESTGIKNETVWPGQKTVMTITLYTKNSFTGPTYFDLPQVPGLLLMESEDRPTLGSTEINNQSYVSKTFEIIVLPIRSGEYLIPSIPVRFAVTGKNRTAIDQKFSTKKSELSASRIPGLKTGEEAITETNLKIWDKWDPVPGRAKTGDAFVRTISMKGDSLSAMTIPPLKHEKIDGLGIYPSPPKVLDKVNRGESTGERVETITYICEKEGKFTIPEITITSWNPQNEELHREILKAVIIKVSANPEFSSRKNQGITNKQESVSKNAVTSITEIIALLLLLAGSLSLVRHWIRRKTLEDRDIEFQLFKNLEESTQSDTPELMNALMKWLDAFNLKFHEHDISTISKIAAISKNTELKNEFRALEENLYGKSPVTIFDGSNLRRIIQTARNDILSLKKNSTVNNESSKLNP